MSVRMRIIYESWRVKGFIQRGDQNRSCLVWHLMQITVWLDGEKLTRGWSCLLRAWVKLQWLLCSFLCDNFLWALTCGSCERFKTVVPKILFLLVGMMLCRLDSFFDPWLNCGEIIVRLETLGTCALIVFLVNRNTLLEGCNAWF